MYMEMNEEVIMNIPFVTFLPYVLERILREDIQDKLQNWGTGSYLDPGPSGQIDGKSSTKILSCSISILGINIRSNSQKLKLF